MSLFEDDRRFNARLQKLRFFPLAVTGGAGCRLRDESGREPLDFSAAWGAASLGYGHPALAGAVAEAARDPAGASILSGATAPATRLAERLLELTPGTGERRVWIGHSGSDANEATVRAVKLATGRPRILAFEGAYHGGIGHSMAVSGHVAQEGVDKDPGLTLVPHPDPYRPPRDGQAPGAAVLARLEALFATTVPPEEVAAFFIEPIQADGGLIVPPEGFLRDLAALCRRHGILLVCDEVKVGLARSGTLHCFEQEGIAPDIVTLGKGLGGGLPVSAAVGPAEIFDAAPAYSMQTLHGNPVCASAALAVLAEIEAEGLVAHARDVGGHLAGALRALADRQPLIGNVRGRGLAIGVELVADRATREPATQATALAMARCFELGLVVYCVGMHSNVLEITPPLVLTREEAEEGVAIIAHALEDVAAGRVDPAVLDGFDGW